MRGDATMTTVGKVASDSARRFGERRISGAVAAVAAAVIGAVKAVRDVVRLPPAVAMSPPAPPRYRRLLADAVYAVLKLPQTVTMVFRHLVRWPVRTLTSVFGIALAGAALPSIAIEVSRFLSHREPKALTAPIDSAIPKGQTDRPGGDATPASSTPASPASPEIVAPVRTVPSLEASIARGGSQ